jgi:alpha-beta hydrolase superfamily lysophospholipase
MPVLLLAGEEDPAGGFGKAPKKLYHVYKSRGMDCRMRLYKGNRHEILQDVDKKKVFHDITRWLDHYTDKQN